MQSLLPPFEAYEDGKPYVFVSYAHKNHAVVFEHITRLHNAGFRIWYDEGIDPGADWSDEIATALSGAEVFLVFISEASIASHNVQKEIIFAIDQRKPMLCVHIEDVELPIGLKMQLGNIQALLEGRFPDKIKFYQRFCAALHPEKTCEGGDPAPIDLDTTHIRAYTPSNAIKLEQRTSVKPKEPESKKKKKGFLVAALLMLVLGVGAFGGHMWWQSAQAGVHFTDKALEHALRDALQKPTGHVQIEDILSLQGVLDLSGKNITNIDLLQHAKNLVELDLDDNAIVDLSPLATLSKLEILSFSNNKVRNLEPLIGLREHLLGLAVGGNPLADIKQLRYFSELRVLEISDIPLTDATMGKYLRWLKVVIVDPSIFTKDGEAGLSEKDFWRFKYEIPTNCEVRDVREIRAQLQK